MKSLEPCQDYLKDRYTVIVNTKNKELLKLNGYTARSLTTHDFLYHLHKTFPKYTYNQILSKYYTQKINLKVEAHYDKRKFYTQYYGVFGTNI